MGKVNCPAMCNPEWMVMALLFKEVFAARSLRRGAWDRGAFLQVLAFIDRTARSFFLMSIETRIWRDFDVYAATALDLAVSSASACSQPPTSCPSALPRCW